MMGIRHMKSCWLKFRTGCHRERCGICLRAWCCATGTPPGQPIGGIVGIQPGGQGYFTSDLKRGRYGMICFFTDAESGLVHYHRGMTLYFSVD